VPKIEVDEAEWNRAQALTAVASKIVANPAARRRLEEAHKLADPSAATPLLDQEAAQLAPVKEMEKNLNTQIEALKKEREDEKREATLAAIADRQTKGLAQLRKQGYTDEGVAAVQKLMEDKGLLDVEDAVAIFERANPPQMPSTPQGGMTGTAWGFADVNADSDKSIQELIATKGNSESVADRMAMVALNDFRSRR
jgi:hypothetical protein